MALKGFTCPAFGEMPGRNNDISYCINGCSSPCVAPNILSAMLKNEDDNPHKGKKISVTMLCGGCKRKTFLERTEDFYLEPDKKLPTFRGSLVHSVIEQSSTKEMEEAGWKFEQHMELPVQTKSGKWKLTGTLDAYDPTRKTIFDVKTLQDYAVEKMCKGKENGTWSSHIADQYVKQLNLYRYMGRQLGLFEAERLRLQVIGFGRLFLTGTTVNLKYKNGFKWVTEPFELPDIPILSDDLIRSWIDTEGDEWYRVLFKKEHAEVCPDEMKWLCKICVFNGTKHCPDPDAERRGDWI